MPSWCRRTLGVLVVALVPAIEGCHSDRTQDHFSGDAHVAEMEETLRHPLHFELVRRFGTASGLLSFTGVGAIAVDGQGHLAVVDDGDCQIVVIAITTGLPVARLGKCGDGPGEFRKIRSLAYFDSHYVALDAASQSVIWMTDDGTETRRLRLQLYKEDGVSFVTRVDQVDDTTLVANVELNPTLGQSGGSQALIAVVDAKSGKTRRRGVSDVQVFHRWTRRQGQLHLPDSRVERKRFRHLLKRQVPAPSPRSLCGRAPPSFGRRCHMPPGEPQYRQS